VLIAINVAVWILITVTGGARSAWVARLALIPQGVVFSSPGGGFQHIAGVADGAPWQLVTSMFTHVAIWHIGFNMLALWFLGPQLEAAVGRARFLALYLLSGLTGSLLVYWFAPLHQPTIGASGAIFGLMGGLLVIALKVKAAPTQLLVWIGLIFLITFLNLGIISWQGHLGGFFGGALVAAIIAYAPRRNRMMWQWVGFGLFFVALVAAYVVRTAMLA
jgi:membrane associated rhomboid family serine protease